MKRLFLLTAFLLTGLIAFAQEQYVYCRIIGSPRFMTHKINVVIDFGQERQVFGDNRLQDAATGNPRIFNSMIDALNFMGRQGWEFVQAYTRLEGEREETHYIMKKPFIALDKEEQREYSEQKEFK
jgi:hypothetical protein